MNARSTASLIAVAASLAGAGAARSQAASPEGTTRSFDDFARLVADPDGPREISLPAGVYRGDLVVKRPISIRGARGTILEGTGQDTVVVIDADDVQLEGLTIRHSGRRSTTEDAGIKAKGERVRVADVRVEDTLFGVSLQACHHCTLERVVVQGTDNDAELRGDGIKLWESHDSVVRGCKVEHARDVVVWYTRRALLEDNVIRHGRYGTHFMYAHDGVARRNRIEDNVVGIFVMYSARLVLEGNVLAGAHGAAGMGLGFKESDSIQIRGNWIVANTTGIYLDFSPRTPEEPVVVEGNVLALDDAALRLHSIEKGAVFHGNDFRDNAETIEVDGGGDALGCDVRGNHFSEYEGYDLDGDGVGDVPHRVNALSSELADTHPALKFFHGTAAMQLVDAIAHAVPLLESRPLLVDPAPRVRAPEVASP
ncbi:MAG TPA: nitrous oxide reductase family maturation protein NosD [Polyangiaceae bacterium]|jgi:nitrous oxidase accessory protein